VRSLRKQPSSKVEGDGRKVGEEVKRFGEESTRKGNIYSANSTGKRHSFVVFLNSSVPTNIFKLYSSVLKSTNITLYSLVRDWNR
jgi:hypothetical protein